MPDLASARAHNLSRLNAIAAVEAGALESNEQLLSGFPFAHQSAQRSAQIWVAAMVEDLEARPFFDDSKIVRALQAMHTRFDAIRIRSVMRHAAAWQMHEIEQRALIYLAFNGGDRGDRMRLSAMCLAAAKPDSGDGVFFLATAIGLATSPRSMTMAECRTAGFQALSKHEEWSQLLKRASRDPEPSPADLDDDEHDEFMQAVLDDRAEFFGKGTDDSPLRIRTKAPRPGAVVVPSFPATPPATGRDDRGRTRKEMAHIAGKRLPFVLTGDVHQHLVALEARAPHLRDLFHEMLLDTCMSAHVDLRPRLLVGPPGSGKSWAAREFADVLGLPISIFDAGSSHDASFGGTPAQWHSAGPAEPLRLVAETGVANPLLVIDEIDKAASSPHNGSIHSSLLTFLDPGNASAFLDPCLQLSVDLSHVNYVLTANDLASVPAPLRDRCRIVRVPNPGPQHVGVLVRRIVEDVARKKGIDPRWEPPLAPDELDNIAGAWGGGSIRRLREVTLAALEFRSRNMGSC